MSKEDKNKFSDDNREEENNKTKKKNKDKQKLKQKLSKLKEENEDLDARYKRALADYQNLQERHTQERGEFVKYANESLLREILPIFDNLKISLQHVGPEEQESAWVKGVKYVVKQFREVLAEHGVEEIEAEGKEFDHNTMEAIEGKGDKVKKEVKSGYKLNGKVIVPAKVIVESENEETGENEENEK
jgi:molecular chaperone GrpE